jgi:cytochrome c-type biogenesis protein CcmF
VVKMIIGYILLAVASLLLLLDIYQLSRHDHSSGSYWRRSAGFFLSVCFIVFIFFLYVNSFLSDNFLLRDVYTYSSADLPFLYKLCASWAGVGGSLLLWSMMLSLVYLIYRTLHRSTIEENTTSYICLSVCLILILAATLLSDPFGQLGFEVKGGLGLNPLLQSSWMAIHPPVIFLGYALPFFPLALSFMNLSKGKESHQRSIRFFMQLSWLVFTLGIALGGIWAYEVLGWGGYWAWDPVETASLLPWLMLTAHFHTSPLAAQGRSLVKEFTTLTVVLLVIFATLITRSGILESVHAFESSVSGTVTPFILLSIYLAGFFVYLKGKVNRPILRLSNISRSEESVSLTISYIALVYITAICLLGILLPAIRSILLGTSYSVGKEFYNTWLLPPTILFVAAVIICNKPRSLELKVCTITIAVSLLGGIVASVLGMPTSNQLANLSLPILLLALAFTLYSFLADIAKTNRTHVFTHIGRSLIHFSLILILLGVFLSSSMESNDQKLLRVGEVYSGGGVTIKLTNVTISSPVGSIYTSNGTLPEHCSLVLHLVISSTGGNHSGQLWTGLYTLYGLASRPLIFRRPLSDVYITLGFTESLYQALLLRLATNKESQLSEFIIQVKVIPFVSLIWIGVTLFAAGIVVSIITEREIQKHVRRE